MRAMSSVYGGAKKPPKSDGGWLAELPSVDIADFHSVNRSCVSSIHHRHCRLSYGNGYHGCWPRTHRFQFYPFWRENDWHLGQRMTSFRKLWVKDISAHSALFQFRQRPCEHCQDVLIPSILTKEVGKTIPLSPHFSIEKCGEIFLHLHYLHRCII